MVTEHLADAPARLAAEAVRLEQLQADLRRDIQSLEAVRHTIASQVYR
jgi:hypothetical protein